MPVLEPCPTFLFADLSGFTALTEAHGDEHAADLAAAFFAATRRLLGHHGADEVKTMGDAVMLHVPDAARALCLAVCLVDELGQQHGALAVRVGLHSGPAVPREGDWFGASVNLAARIAGLAESDEVLLSADTARMAGGPPPGRRLQPRGSVPLRNVSEPVEVLAAEREDRTRRPGTIDPVCRMVVRPGEGERTDWNGATVAFCSEGCRATFRAAPARYLPRTGDTG